MARCPPPPAVRNSEWTHIGQVQAVVATGSFLPPRQELVEDFSRCFPAERFARSGIQRVSYSVQRSIRMAAQIRAFRTVLAQQTIRVLVGATLAWALRIAEGDRHIGREL